MIPVGFWMDLTANGESLWVVILFRIAIVLHQKLKKSVAYLRKLRSL